MASETSYRYLAVLDFEATCWDTNNEHEIIEFPTVIIDLDTNTVIDRFEQFVLPKNKPRLSEFCHNLTTITQDQVNSGISLPEALKRHQQFMSKYPSSIFVTCGDWDLKTMLPMDAINHNISTPGMYRRWINIKRVFDKFFGLKKSTSMIGMLSVVGLELEGTHHRGIDDCVNIARICCVILNKGWNPSKERLNAVLTC
ncbi:MAG: exonuclease domain-containing protein [Candidatus Colwellbacteria bacterium]|nr:exonuclease domain-containing protein [Candidatus Colwellbacteria bacterium]